MATLRTSLPTKTTTAVGDADGDIGGENVGDDDFPEGDVSDDGSRLHAHVNGAGTSQLTHDWADGANAVAMTKVTTMSRRC